MTFKKGQSGNPGGRPKGMPSVVSRLIHYLQVNPRDTDAIVSKLVEKAKRGEIKAIQEIMDRVDGKPIERHQVEGELPIRLVFVPASQIAKPVGSPVEICEGEVRELPASSQNILAT